MEATVSSTARSNDGEKPPQSPRQDVVDPGEGPILVSGTAPAWTRNLYRRMAFGRKHFFGQDDATQAANYYVTNLPIFYRGDHPKYTDASVAKRAVKRKSHARKQKWRKFWCRPEKPPAEPLEEDVTVEGFVTLFKAWRPRFLTRTVKWQLGGHEYRWTGTRRFMTGRFRKWKRVSHDLEQSEKVGSPPNKTRSLLGKLRRYPAPGAPSTNEVMESIRSSPPDESKFHKKLVKQLNLEGPHSGDLTGEAIALTCWIVVEGEHRLRYKILDLLEEIAETVGG
ncbi:hypothetical protein N658DRAFT_513972 [Parathielavia hyrcaniae]|uniref:Uncharacterized protein n=1 Tax=Parathielavia hyrcaniae TaxID=113614 RepID=A0AAN6QB11_9PEZI|nr:hypothetical protein N658DRAFT_513972 [Parathielavia hyrcaniae]